jgi:hypothetical protein
MNNMPSALRKELAANPFYSRCAITGVTDQDSRIEWHHNLIHAGKQVQERWCIIPLVHIVHAKAENKNVREALNWIMTNRATDEQLRKYSKAVDYIKIRDRLNKKFGGPWQEGKRYFRITSTGNIATLL